MTNKEAAWHLGTYSTTMGSGQTTDEQHNEAKRIAIKVLEQEPCEDCISRAEVLSIYDEWFATCNIADKKASPKAKIKALPSVQPEIIRCKDCREFRRYINTDITFCDRTEVEVKGDDFCSHAKKMEVEHETD